MTLVALALIPNDSHATEVGNQRTFGLGFAIGTPTSLVGKWFIGPGQAIDFGLGFTSYGYGCWNGRRYVNCNSRYRQVGIHADYLWQDNLIYDKVTLDWHIGVGGRLWFLDDEYYGPDGSGAVAAAARMPVGLDLMFNKPSFLELYFEVAPSLYLTPRVDMSFEAVLGVRFYF